MRTRPYRRLVATAVAVTACVPVVGVQTALADASGKASCIGIEASDLSPPGSSDEFLGGMPELVSVVRGLGGPPGAIISPVAKLRAGSHAACDAAE